MASWATDGARSTSVEDVLRGGLSARWPVHRGKKILADELAAEAEFQPVRGVCSNCGEVFDGLFREEREWFRQHRCGGMAA